MKATLSFLPGPWLVFPGYRYRLSSAAMTRVCSRAGMEMVTGSVGRWAIMLNGKAGVPRPCCAMFLWGLATGQGCPGISSRKVGSCVSCGCVSIL